MTHGPRPMTYREKMAIHQFRTGDPGPEPNHSEIPDSCPPRPWAAYAVLVSSAVVAASLAYATGGWFAALMLVFCGAGLLGALALVIAEQAPPESGVRL